MAEKEIYMDRIAASRTRREAIEAMTEALDIYYGNPQSVHSRGQASAEILARARHQVASLLGAKSEEIIFTSNGSEANNLAIKGIAAGRKKKSNRIIVSAIEHLSVLNPARTLAREGFELVTLPVDSYGFVSLEKLREELSRGAALVSIVHASTEIGTIEPIEEIAAACQQADVPLHSDGWGAAGVIPVDIESLGISAYTIAAQNFGGPPGAAALVVRKGIPLRPLIEGGVQERGLRAGQENVPAIAGMGAAAELAAHELEANTPQLRKVRDALIERIPAEIPDVMVTGHPERRLPNHASFCFKYIEGEGLLLHLDMMRIMAASGSACTSKALKGSHVLQAIGIEPALAQGSIVFSLSLENSLEDVGTIISAIKPAVERLRAMSPLSKRK